MKAETQEHTDLFVKAAHRAIRKAGWNPRYDLEILKPDGTGTAQKVRYGFRPDRVRLTHAPALKDELGRTLETLGQAGPENTADALAEVVASQVYLQVGSHRVCPYSAYDYAELLEASADGVRSAGGSDSDVRMFTTSITSFFIASVVSGVYAIEGPAPAPFRRGFLLDQINSSLTSGHALSAYVALYVNTQLRLWSKDKHLAQAVHACFPMPFDALDFETDRGTAILLDTFEFVDCERDGVAWINRDTSSLILNELKYQWRKWPIKAFQFAEMLTPYVISEQQGCERPPQPQASPRDRDMRPSEQARQRRIAVGSGSPSHNQELLHQQGELTPLLPHVPADPFRDRLATGPPYVTPGCGRRGKSPPGQELSFGMLDAMYRGRVADLSIKGESARKPGGAFPIAHLARDEIVDGFPGLDQIDWNATRLTPEGQLQLYEKRLPVASETPVHLAMNGFPDLLLVVDSSGSMGWNPVEGAGPYDSLLRAVFAVFGFLEKTGKAYYMRFAVVNFSNTTLKTAWLPYHALSEVKRLLFKRQGGGTKLDCSVLRDVAGASSDRFLCLMVTDSQVKNATEVVATIQRIESLGHGFVLLQIGRRVPMTEAMQRCGHAVHVISDHRQLEGLCLEHARKTWHS